MNFIPRLTGFSNLHKSNLDLTWNYFNNIVSSKEILELVLTKLYSIPMVDYMAYTDETNTKKVYEELSLTSEEAKIVQDFNIELLNIKKVIEIYCLQMFSLASYSSNILYDLIESIPEETNVNNIQEFLNTIDTFKSSQEGGGLNKILVTIVKLFVIMTIITPITDADVSSSLELVTNKNNPYQPYNTALISVQDQDFKSAVNEIKQSQPKSEVFDISKTIVAYDSEVERDMKTITGQLMSLFSTPEDGVKIFNDIVNDFNKKSHMFSQQASSSCTELIEIIYDKGLFSNIQDLDSIEVTNEKIDGIQRIVKEEKNNILEKAKVSVIAAVADPINMVPYLFSFVETMSEFISSTTQNQMMETLSADQREITAEEKIVLQTNLRKYSKLYCSYGYNLQIGFEQNEKLLKIIGSKIEYSWMEGLITVLEKNLELEIKKLSQNTEKNNSLLLDLLTSTKQRLNILKSITIKLEEIINFSADSKMINLQVYPSKDTPQQIKTYFDSELDELNSLLSYLQMQFPEQKKEFQQNKQLIEEKLQLSIDNQEIIKMNTNADAIINQMISERTAKSVASKWYAFKTISESYVEIAKNGTKFALQSSEEILTEVTTGLSNILTKPTLAAIQNVLWLLITNPSGWIVLGTALMSILIMLQLSGIGMLKTFVSNGTKFIVFIFGNIVYVFKVIITPFGWLVKKEIVLYIEPRKETESRGGKITRRYKKYKKIRKTAKHRGRRNTNKSKRKHKKQKPKMTIRR
jgi:hypothetical protein